MQFLHIADLHLGKRLNDVSLLEDQVKVLGQLTDMAVTHRVDAVLIAGDIYQKASPQSEAMTVFNDFVTGLCEKGIRVFAISGNHDSDQRISYFSELLKKADMYVSEKFTGVLQQITLQDEYGPVVISLLPFIRPAVVKRCFPEETVKTYQDALLSVLAHSHVDPGVRNVLVAHQFMIGAEISDSEEVSVGGLDQINAALLDDFDYVALGHLHKPQQAGRKTCRYAGSPLKYSFSEAHHQKSAVLVKLGAKGDVKMELLPIQQPHEMWLIHGTLSEVLAMPYSEDYVQVTLTDELVPPDARVSISTVFPNMMGFGVSNSRTKEIRDVLAGDIVQDMSMESLFVDFYRLQNNDAMPPESHLKLLRYIMKEMEEKHHEATEA